MQNYVVGNSYPQFETGRNSFVIDYHDGAFTLFWVTNNPSPEDARQYSEPLEMTFSEVNQIGFFCARFGSLPWRECPFSPVLYVSENEKISFPKLAHGEGLPATVYIANSMSGRLLKMRPLILPAEFSQRIIDWTQTAAGAGASLKKYTTRVNGVYANFSSEDIVAQSKFRCRVGVAAGSTRNGTHKIIIKKPSQKPEVVTCDGTYRCDLKNIVSSDDFSVEYVDLYDEACLLCDEDGIAKRLPFNFCLRRGVGIDRVYGTVVFVRYKWENPWEKELWDYELASLTDEDIDYILNTVLDEDTQRKLSEDAEQYTF